MVGIRRNMALRPRLPEDDCIVNEAEDYFGFLSQIPAKDGDGMGEVPLKEVSALTAISTFSSHAATHSRRRLILHENGETNA